MNHTVVMRQGDMFRQKHTSCHIPGYFSRNIIPLGGSKPRIFIGILLGKLLILVADQL